MKRLLAVLVFCSLPFACDAQQSLGTLEAKAFKKLMEEKKNVQLVDVRTQKEFDDGKISGAVLIDFYRRDFQQQLQKLDKTKPIAVYCTIGGRSGATAKMLSRLGFTEIYDLRGGIIDWQKAGFKLVKD